MLLVAIKKNPHLPFVSPKEISSSHSCKKRTPLSSGLTGFLHPSDLRGFFPRVCPGRQCHSLPGSTSAHFLESTSHAEKLSEMSLHALESKMLLC